MSENYDWDLTWSDNLDADSHFNGGVAAGCHVSPFDMYFGSPIVGPVDFSTFDLGEPPIPQPNYLLVNTWLQNNYWASLPYDQIAQPAEPGGIYVGGGQLPPPSPAHAPLIPPNPTGHYSVASPSSPNSSHSGPGLQYQCKVLHCERTFKKCNDLKRHSITVHRDYHHNNNITKCYRCPCGYSSVRKDNYLRHHFGDKRQRARCTRVAEQVSSDNPFECFCEEADCSASAHLLHVTGCTLGHHGPPGRPRRNH
ncbi:hypothetical protein PG991_015020 [Apiospora marii]|uniref:C2H2-type domain-containing protein n=1 Tax=Apiospora marii TaxID=335849 RepID=A0ABR1R3L5_9PEZI